MVEVTPLERGKEIMGRPKAIKILLPEGDLDGLRIIEIGNWTGKILIVPRILVPEVANQRAVELSAPGLYFLLAGNTERYVYVGETEDFYRRIRQHQKRPDWDRVIVVLAKDRNLHRAHLKYLEYSAYKLIREAGRVTVSNLSQPQEPNLSEMDRSEMLHFMFNIKLALEGAGYNFMQTMR